MSSHVGLGKFDFRFGAVDLALVILGESFIHIPPAYRFPLTSTTVCHIVFTEH